VSTTIRPARFDVWNLNYKFLFMYRLAVRETVRIYDAEYFNVHCSISCKHLAVLLLYIAWSILSYRTLHTPVKYWFAFSRLGCLIFHLQLLLPRSNSLQSNLLWLRRGLIKHEYFFLRSLLLCFLFIILNTVIFHQLDQWFISWGAGYPFRRYKTCHTFYKVNNRRDKLRTGT
jgi:hypothetical protein